MNKLLFKQISILSAIFGCMLGIISLIPIIRNITAIGITFFLAPAVIIYLKKLNILKDINIKTGMIIGTISGIVSITAFIITLTPIDLLLGLFIKNGYIEWISILIKNAGFFNYILILLFLWVLNGTTNAFSGFATAYLYEILKGMKE